MRSKEDILNQYSKKTLITKEEYENAERLIPPDEFNRLYSKVVVRAPIGLTSIEKDTDFEDKITYFRHDYPKEQDMLYNTIAEIDRKVSFIYIVTIINVVLFVCSLLLTMCGAML